MRLLVFSDLHNDRRALERLMAIEADQYVCAGDLVSWERGLDVMGEIMRPHHDRMWVLPGNHETEDQIARFCERFQFQPFHGATFTAGTHTIAGLGYSNRTPFKTPGEYTEEEIAARLEPFAGLPHLVLIAHCPPKGTPLDQAAPGLHFGSTAVRAFVDAHQPEWLCCGHIHEAEGAEATLGRTRGVNVGKRGYVLELP